MFKLCILECPSGKFSFAGSVPIELCEKISPKTCNRDKYTPMVFDTHEQALSFAQKNGYLK